MRTWTIKLCLALSVCLSCDDNVLCAFRPRILRADGSEASYFTDINILYGNPLELYCMGEAYNELKMCKDNEMFYTTTVNETTIRLFDERPDKRFSFVYCHYVNGVDKTNIAAVRVLVDMLPQAANFRCSSNLQHYSCTWTSPNLIIHRFSLYHVRDNLASLLCNVMQYGSMHCTWDTKRFLNAEKPFAKTLTFQLVTCNHYGCGHQIFKVNHFAIFKSEPPEQLTILWKRSHTAILTWKIPKSLDSKELHVDHKISYWYSGINPRQVNTSSEIIIKQDNCFIFKLELPCADTFYEVRVSIKPNEAVGEEYWSDEAVITLVTDHEPANIAALVESSCHTQPKVKITRDVMLYKLDQFKGKMRDEQNRLKEKIKSFKLRVNELNGM